MHLITSTFNWCLIDERLCQVGCRIFLKICARISNVFVVLISLAPWIIFSPLSGLLHAGIANVISNAIAMYTRHHNKALKCTTDIMYMVKAWWRHQMEAFAALLAIFAIPVNSPHKDQWRGALLRSLICVWINGCVNNREAGDLRRYRAQYDVTVMISQSYLFTCLHHTKQKLNCKEFC